MATFQVVEYEGVRVVACRGHKKLQAVWLPSIVCVDERNPPASCCPKEAVLGRARTNSSVVPYQLDSRIFRG